MSVTLPKRVEISPEVLIQELEGEAVLLNLESERYYGFDKVGTRMWKLLAENGDVHATFEQLLSEYTVEEDVLRQDMAVWIAKLSQAGLIHIPETEENITV
jgi:hypothetical protein